MQRHWHIVVGISEEPIVSLIKRQNDIIIIIII